MFWRESFPLSWSCLGLSFDLSDKLWLLAGMQLLSVTLVVAVWRRLDELIMDQEQNGVLMGMKFGA